MQNKHKFEPESFAARVHLVVQSIPPGTVRSYQEVAQAIGQPRAARAVANVLAKNYDPSIPCHRVIRSNGSLGGYNRGGAQMKQRVLLTEGFNPEVTK